MKKIFLLAIALAYSTASISASIDGKWLTRDDKDGKPKAIIAISGSTGKVVDVAPGVDNNCTVCAVKGPLKNRVILRGLHPDGDGFEGKITDPKNNRTYDAHITLSGKSLKVCAYFGFKFIGRCQTWRRI